MYLHKKQLSLTCQNILVNRCIPQWTCHKIWQTLDMNSLTSSSFPMYSTHKAYHTMPLSNPLCSHTPLSQDGTLHHFCTDTAGHSCSQNNQGCSPVHSISHDIHVHSCNVQLLHHMCHFGTNTSDYSWSHSNHLHMSADRCLHGNWVDRYNERCHSPLNISHHSGKDLMNIHSVDSWCHGNHANSHKIH